MRILLRCFFAIVLSWVSFPALSASIINDTETEKVISELIKPLAVAANIPETRLNVHIVNDDTFNAFVMGGEDVYIYTGLLTRIQTPNALRAVVAHELGHTLGGHMAQMSDRMAIEMKRNGTLGKPCPDYTDTNVSMKVVRIIQSYTNIVNRMVWRKDN